ncbi:DPP IV N-terminal domain-containing protein [Candidatus Aminicenantes bacterium AH-873-B07]|jgi:Tol biopolymer transport system component|nr:DPP IV N-terminal domain-containing protein [Candidatus Aminicenantes bacterium AH-873-B07]
MKKIIIFPLLLIFLLFLISCKIEKDKDPIQKNINLNSFKPLVPFKGKIVFQSDMDGDNEIYLLTKNGLRKLTNNTWSDEYPKWSPDGKKIAFTANPGGSYEIFVMNEDGSNIVQLTTTKYDAIEHTWFPNGKKIAYTIERRRGIFRSYKLWMVDIKTKKTKRLLSDFQGSSALPNFSPSGHLMGFTGKKRIGWDVAVYNFRTGKVLFLTEGGKACRPTFSRDGKKIAYVSSVSDGKGDIWIMNPDGTGKVRLTRRDKTYDYFPSWSPDNRLIVFSSSPRNHKKRGNWALYLVNIRTGKVVPFLDTPGRDLFPDWY